MSHAGAEREREKGRDELTACGGFGDLGSTSSAGEEYVRKSRSWSLGKINRKVKLAGAGDFYLLPTRAGTPRQIENVGISCAILRIHGDVPFEFVRWSGQVPLYPMLNFRGVTKDNRQLRCSKWSIQKSQHGLLWMRLIAFVRPRRNNRRREVLPR